MRLSVRPTQKQVSRPNEDDRQELEDVIHLPYALLEGARRRICRHKETTPWRQHRSMRDMTTRSFTLSAVTDVTRPSKAEIPESVTLLDMAAVRDQCEQPRGRKMKSGWRAKSASIVWSTISPPRCFQSCQCHGVARGMPFGGLQGCLIDRESKIDSFGTFFAATFYANLLHCARCEAYLGL